MKRWTRVVILCVSCALIGSALAAQGASARTRGFTCTKDVITKTFSDAHCIGTGTPKEWGHKGWAGGTQAVDSAGTLNSGKQTLKATINGIVVELVTEGGVSGESTVENAEVGGEEVVKGTGTVTYTGITVAKPAAKSCNVFTDNGGVAGEKGVIHTNELSAMTTNEMGLKFTPASGTIFATFILGGCSGSEALEGLNGTYTINGSVIGEPNGGETKFTHAATTPPETLLLNNSIKAGLEGGATWKNPVSGNVLACTTPEPGTQTYKADG